LTGQHSDAGVPVLFNARHVVVGGQQKFDGRPWPHCRRLLLPGHVRASRLNRLNASAAPIAAAKTGVGGKLADTKQRSAKSRTCE
jgi:hypothetical protein